MSLKKKSKSLGHLTALGSHPCSPDVEPKVGDEDKNEDENEGKGRGKGGDEEARRSQLVGQGSYMGSVSPAEGGGHQFKIPPLSPTPIKGAPQSSRVMERGLPPVEGGVWVVKGKGCRRGRMKRTNFVEDKLKKKWKR